MRRENSKPFSIYKTQIATPKNQKTLFFLFDPEPKGEIQEHSQCSFIE